MSDTSSEISTLSEVRSISIPEDGEKLSDWSAEREKLSDWSAETLESFDWSTLQPIDELGEAAVAAAEVVLAGNTVVALRVVILDAVLESWIYLNESDWLSAVVVAEDVDVAIDVATVSIVSSSGMTGKCSKIRR